MEKSRSINIILFITGILVLIIPELLRVYFIMPFPGSQINNTLDVAYFLHTKIYFFRIAGLLLLVNPFKNYLINGKIKQRLLFLIPVIFYVVIFYFFNFRFMADKMFLQQHQVLLADVKSNKVVSEKLIIGINKNGNARAYPIEIIGYHHQVADTINGQQIIATYCTVCRTGRVYSTGVNGKPETFRLVGMDYFNAMFEDKTTGSWWRQETGEAVTGPLKGMRLQEIPSQQMMLSEWIKLYQQTLILQPDTFFQKQYDELKNYDNGKINGSLERTDSLSWKNKSWVVGLVINNVARAYDWNLLKQFSVINDTLSATPIVIILNDDNVSFAAFNRNVDGTILNFVSANNNQWKDLETNSKWAFDGKCMEGKLVGKHLKPIQCYQEFWHSWKSFHPATTMFTK